MTQPATVLAPYVESPADPSRPAPPAPRREVGQLLVARGEERSPLPLAGVELAATVAGRAAQVSLVQTFHNPYAERLEAVYVFPLPGGAAVTDFELRVGDRVVRGVVRERGEARVAYQQAMAAGHRAALLEQERDGVFTVQVGNLPPGEEVTVRLVWCELLPFFDDGATELRLPLVVAPRYIPGTPVDGQSGRGTAADTDVVPDASRITPPRLAPGFDPRVALRIAVELLRDEAGANSGWRGLACSQHATATDVSGDRLRVELARQDEALDRDFVLRWALVGDRLRTSLLVQPAAAGKGNETTTEPGYGVLSIVPPARQGFLGLARDVVFVVDRSGSMGGVKMSSAARACSTLLATLGPRDRFAILAFDDRLEWMPGAGGDGEAARFRWAGEAEIERGHDFLHAIDARGGTELDAAVAAALAALAGRRDGAQRAAVVVVLTDGQVGDEHRVLRRLQESLGDARVFTVGIDTAVNAAFLTRLAAVGGGTATCVEPGAAVEQALVAVGREIGAPLVVDLRVEDVEGSVELRGQAPARLPDLFTARAATVFLRVQPGRRVRISGRFAADGSAFVEEVTGRAVALPALGPLWARARVRDLEDRYRVASEERPAIAREIVALAVEHRLLTRFTAFVAVDEREVVDQSRGARTVVQPVAMPARWELQEEAPDLAAGIAYAAAGAVPAPPAAAEQLLPSPARGRFRPSMAAASSPPPGGAQTRSFMAPPSAPRAKASKVGQVLNKLRGAVAGGAVEGARPVESSPVDPAREAAAAREVDAALTALIALLADAGNELAAGRLPDAAVLEAARVRLRAALGLWADGARVPLLQKLVRSGLAELVAAFADPTADPATVRDLLQRQRDALADAEREARAVLGGDAPAPGGGWGATV